MVVLARSLGASGGLKNLGKRMGLGPKAKPPAPKPGGKRPSKGVERLAGVVEPLINEFFSSSGKNASHFRTNVSFRREFQEWLWVKGHALGRTSSAGSLDLALSHIRKKKQVVLPSQNPGPRPPNVATAVFKLASQGISPGHIAGEVGMSAAGVAAVLKNTRVARQAFGELEPYAFQIGEISQRLLSSQPELPRHVCSFKFHLIEAPEFKSSEGLSQLSVSQVERFLYHMSFSGRLKGLDTRIGKLGVRSRTRVKFEPALAKWIEQGRQESAREVASWAGMKLVTVLMAFRKYGFPIRN